MPQIIVVADRPNRLGKKPVMLNERVSAADFESEHFATLLVERLGWAVTDASAVEQERADERPATAAASAARRAS
jgi:hypothetical protein